MSIQKIQSPFCIAIQLLIQNSTISSVLYHWHNSLYRSRNDPPILTINILWFLKKQGAIATVSSAGEVKLIVSGKTIYKASKEKSCQILCNCINERLQQWYLACVLRARSVSNASSRICVPCVSILVNSGICFKSKYSIYERHDYVRIYNAKKSVNHSVLMQ